MEATRDAVHSTVLDEVRTGLMEAERNLLGDALRTQIQNSVEITRSRPDSGLPADTHLLDRQIKSDRLARKVARDLAPVHLVLPIDIAEPTAPPVPRIPIREYAPLLRHC